MELYNDLRAKCSTTKYTYTHVWEEIFGSTSKPPNNIYVILILGKNAAI